MITSSEAEFFDLFVVAHFVHYGQHFERRGTGLIFLNEAFSGYRSGSEFPNFRAATHLKVDLLAGPGQVRKRPYK